LERNVELYKERVIPLIIGYDGIIFKQSVDLLLTTLDNTGFSWGAELASLYKIIYNAIALSWSYAEEQYNHQIINIDDNK
jgi:hypothetical protein